MNEALISKVLTISPREYKDILFRHYESAIKGFFDSFPNEGKPYKNVISVPRLRSAFEAELKALGFDGIVETISSDNVYSLKISKDKGELFFKFEKHIRCSALLDAAISYSEVCPTADRNADEMLKFYYLAVLYLVCKFSDFRQILNLQRPTYIMKKNNDSWVHSLYSEGCVHVG